MTNNPQDAMNLKEVAALLGMSERTIYNWAQTKYIPAFKLGKSWRFKKAEILNWMETNRSGKTPDNSMLGFSSSYGNSRVDYDAIKMKNRMLRTEWRAKQKTTRDLEEEVIARIDHNSDDATMSRMIRPFEIGSPEEKDLRKRLNSYLTNDAPPSQLDLDEILNLNYNYIQQFSSIESIIQGLNNDEVSFG